jgi:hypothetical protein
MSTTETIIAITKRCYHCGEEGALTMPREEGLRGIEAYKNGEFAQDAFPFLSADEREQIISGTHPKCWAEMFGTDGE